MRDIGREWENHAASRGTSLDACIFCVRRVPDGDAVRENMKVLPSKMRPGLNKHFLERVADGYLKQVPPASPSSASSSDQGSSSFAAALGVNDLDAFNPSFLSSLPMDATKAATMNHLGALGQRPPDRAGLDKVALPPGIGGPHLCDNLPPGIPNSTEPSSLAPLAAVSPPAEGASRFGGQKTSSLLANTADQWGASAVDDVQDRGELDAFGIRKQLESWKCSRASAV